MLFNDRIEAGQLLAKELKGYAGKSNVLVLGLARGGVILAAEIARELGVLLDVLIVHKVGAPDNPELALGAIAEEGPGVFNDELIALLGVSKEYLRKETEKMREVVKERKHLYLQGKESVGIGGKEVILVDDGIATGASMKVAIEVVRMAHPKKIVLAIPVGPRDTLQQMRSLVDEVVCLSTPMSFQAVGAFYKEFPQVSDQEIVSLIQS